MNEKVIQDLYLRAKGKGYKKSVDDFRLLLATNKEVFEDAYSYVVENGYSKPRDQFAGLVGSKKKETTELPSTPSIDAGLSATPSMETPKPSVSSPLKKKINQPSRYNKNIEARDFAEYQKASYEVINAAKKGDKNAADAAMSRIKGFEAVYGDEILKDSNLSEDKRLANKEYEKFKPKPQEPVRFQETKAPFKPRFEVKETDVELTEDELKSSIMASSIELGLTDDLPELSEQSRIDQVQSEFDGDTILEQAKDLYNKYIATGISKITRSYTPFESSPVDKSMRKAVIDLDRAGSKYTEDDVIAKAKEIRLQELREADTEKAVANYFRDGSLLFKTDQQEQILENLKGIKNKKEYQLEKFNSKIAESKSYQAELLRIKKKIDSGEKLSESDISDYKYYSNKLAEVADDLQKNYSNINNDVEDIQDINSEIDLFKRNYTRATNAAALIGKTTINMAKGVVGIQTAIQSELNPIDSVGDSWEYAYSKLDDAEKFISENVRGPVKMENLEGVGDWARWAGNTIIEQSPQLALTYFTGGAAPVILGATSAGNKYMEIKDNPEYSKAQVYLASILTGGVEALSEKIELDAMRTVFPSMRVAKAAKGADLDLLRRELRTGMKGEVLNAIEKGAFIASTANKEGISELVAQVGGNLVDRHVLDKDVSILDGVADAYLSGAVVGAGLSIAPSVVSSVIAPFSYDPNKELTSNAEKVRQLASLLPEIKNEKDKSIITGKINALIDKNKAKLDEAISVFNALSIEDKKEGIKGLERMMAIKKDVQRILSDKTISSEQATAMVDVYTEEYNDLVKRRLELINKGKNAIQEQTTSEVSVQPEAAVSGEVAQGTPQAEPQVITEEGIQEEIIIDKPTISINSKAEVDKVISATPETETVQTFNSDGTVYSDGGLVIPVVSENLTQEELTPERIAEFAEKHKNKIGSKAVKIGIYKFPNSNQVSIDLNIVVPRSNRDVGVEFGRIAGQESLFDLDTFENVKTGADGSNPMTFTDEQFKEISRALEEGRMPNLEQQQTVAQEQGTPTTIEGTRLRDNIKKAVAKVFKKFETKSFKNGAEMKAYAKQKYGSDIDETDAARVFATESGSVEVLVNEELADDTAFGHEMWHGILLKAFGDNQVLFRRFRKSIDKALRDNGFADIADELDAFTERYGEDEVPSEEYLAQLGGMLTSGRINPENLTSEQKNLLQKIKDIINKFAIELTGQPVFLKDATADTILNFMATMSDMMAKGEDISGFFVEPNKVDESSLSQKTRAQVVGAFNGQLNYNEKGQILAPNGKPSNLSEDLAKEVRTTNFKDWFGDWENNPQESSKVVDENGEPLVVYHGSPFGGIESFNRGASAKSPSGLREFGTYFTTNKELANLYATSGKLKEEVLVDINKKIYQLKNQLEKTRNSKDYNSIEEEIKILEISKSPRVYSAFLRLDSIKEFNANKETFEKAWNKLKVDAGYKTAINRDAMQFLKDGSFGVEKVDGVKASNITDIVSFADEKNNEKFVGDVYLVFDTDNDNIRLAEPNKVKTRAKKAKYIPDNVYNVLTKDGNGNIVFHHYSFEQRDEILPMSGSGKNFTSEEEQRALRSVGGLGMYYTQVGQVEGGVGPVRHTVLVPEEKIYYMNKDELNFYDEAKERFLKYMNRGKPREQWTEFAFNPNFQVAFITQVDSENGFDMVISKWRNDSDFRAQSAKPLKVNEEDIMFDVPEVKYEVGDLVNIHNKNAVVLDVTNDGIITYKSSNSSGKFDVPLSERSMRYGKILMIEKGPFILNEETGEFDKVMTRASKSGYDKIAGYDTMQKELEGVIKRSKSRGASWDKQLQNAMDYMQQSLVYERADDVQRNEMIRDLSKMFGKKMKSAPSAERILGMMTSKEDRKNKKDIIDQIKRDARTAKDAVAFINMIRKDLQNRISGLTKAGTITLKQATAITKAINNVNLTSPDAVSRLVDYISKVYESAEYLTKLSEANSLRKKIKKASKGKDVQAATANTAKNFSMVDPKSVKDIDQYLENAKEALKSLVPTKAMEDLTVRLRVAAELEKINDYVREEMKLQEKMKKEELLAKYEDLVESGVLDKSMTYDEVVQTIKSLEEADDIDDSDTKTAIVEFLKSRFEELSEVAKGILDTGLDPFSGEIVDLTESQVELIEKLLDINFDQLSPKDMRLAVEYLDNFTKNQITDGIAYLTNVNTGIQNAEKLLKSGYKSRRLKLFGSKYVGRVFGEQFSSLPMVIERMFGSTRRAMKFSEMLGLDRVVNGTAKARREAKVAIKEYENRFFKIKDFNSPENIYERGVAAFLMRGDGTPKEFSRRMKLVEQSIKALESGTELEQKKAAVLKQVYDKFSSATNQKEVEALMSKSNLDAVKWWINKWNDKYDALSEVSRNVYNSVLGSDQDYTPDTYVKLEAGEKVESTDKIESAFRMSTKDYTVKKKTGVLMEVSRPNSLPKGRVLSFDFDYNNSRAFESAMIDIETAEGIRQVYGFINSKSFAEMGYEIDMLLLERRINSYIGAVRGKDFVPESEIKKASKAINALVSIGAARALGGITQPIKQTIPVAVNTLINAGRLDVAAAFDKSVNDWINRSGAPIANRGLDSLTEASKADRYLDQSAIEKTGKSFEFIQKAGEMWMKVFLSNPDVFIARASFISYYKNELKRQGENPDQIDWENHKPNKKALQYAQAMIDRQQNITDSDLAGEFMRAKDPIKAISRSMLFSFMNFVMNQKNRIYNDVVTMSNGVASKQEKAEAARSLAAAGAEMFTFTAISTYIGSLLTQAAYAALGFDEPEEEEERRNKYAKMGVATNFVNDLLSPLPMTNGLIDQGVNKALESFYENSQVPEEERIYLFEPQDKGPVDALGAAGIPFTKISEAYDNLEIAKTGVFEKEVFGKKMEYRMQDEDLEVIRKMSFIPAMYSIGLLPTETNALYNKVIKIAKKRASKEGGASGGFGKSLYKSGGSRYKSMY
jgi:hypothetical protein